MAHLITLWRKELRQQRAVLLVAAVLYAFMGFGAWLTTGKDGGVTSRMAAVPLALRVWVPLLALVQAHVAVVREYRQKTQLFVEALPIGRWQVPLARLSFGLVTQSALAGAVWLSLALASGSTELGFLAISGTRTLAYVLVCWTLAFGLATLGRLRWLIYASVIVGYSTLSRQGVELERFGPFALLDPGSFPYERAALPLRALLESAALSAGGLLLGLGLPLWHEGSAAEVLSRRASTGEKAGFWVVVLVQLVLAQSLEREQKREPFSFTGTTLLASERQNVQIMYGASELEPRARSLLDVLERLAGGLEAELGVAAPPLRVAHNASLEGPSPRFASGALGAGVLLEVNLGAEGFELGDVVFLAAHGTFAALSADRALFEPNHWFTDGFASYWAPPRDPRASDPRWLDALMVRRKLALDARQLSEWEQLSDRVGEEAAVSIGFTLVELLARRHGREQLLAMARALLVRPTIQNGYDWLFAERADLPALLQQTTGEDWPAFVGAYQAQLAASALRLAAPLAAIPALDARLAVERTEVSNDIVYQLSGPPPAAALECKLLHAKLQPFDHALWSEALQKHDIPWPAAAPGVAGRLRGRYASGERVFASVDCQLPGLRRKVRLAMARLEVP